MPIAPAVVDAGNASPSWPRRNPVERLRERHVCRDRRGGGSASRPRPSPRRAASRPIRCSDARAPCRMNTPMIRAHRGEELVPGYHDDRAGESTRTATTVRREPPPSSPSPGSARSARSPPRASGRRRRQPRQHVEHRHEQVHDGDVLEQPGQRAGRGLGPLEEHVEHARQGEARPRSEGRDRERGSRPFSSARAAVNPPKNTSVMPCTSIPASRAEMAWALSWRNTEPKKMSAPKTAKANAVPDARSGKPWSNLAQNVATSRTRSRSTTSPRSRGRPGSSRCGTRDRTCPEGTPNHDQPPRVWDSGRDGRACSGARRVARGTAFTPAARVPSRGGGLAGRTARSVARHGAARPRYGSHGPVPR